MQEPLVHYPNYEKEFIVVTDASKRELGDVLLQQDDNGEEPPVSFANRTLTMSEKKNYPITELEAFGIVFALKKFKNMIYRYPVRVARITQQQCTSLKRRNTHHQDWHVGH